MATYEDHIDALERSKDVSSEAIEAATASIAFVAALHGMFVDNGVLNDEATIDVCVLENLVDAFHGELAAAAIFLAQESFDGVPEVLRLVSETIGTKETDPKGVVPTVVRKGFSRLAARIEQTRAMQTKVANKQSAEPSKTS
jgi:hypothetical protein